MMTSLADLSAASRGKLFEIKYTDYLNDGRLPPGYHAEMARVGDRAGWDIAIRDGQGNVDEVLQLKATESAEYIGHALERYPYIDVVSTEEVYSEVTMGDMAEHVINSGISNEELTQYVQDTVMAGAMWVMKVSCHPSFPMPLSPTLWLNRRNCRITRKGKNSVVARCFPMCAMCWALPSGLLPIRGGSFP